MHDLHDQANGQTDEQNLESLLQEDYLQEEYNPDLFYKALRNALTQLESFKYDQESGGKTVAA